MELKEIKSILSFNEIFSYIKNKNFKYKLTAHSKKYQKRLQLNLDSFKDAHYNKFSDSFLDIFSSQQLDNQNKEQFCQKLDYIIKNLLKSEINEDTNIKYLAIINRTLCRDEYLLKIFNYDSIINFEIAKDISLIINKLITIFSNKQEEKKYEIELNLILKALNDILKEYNKDHIKKKNQKNFSCIYLLLTNIINYKEEILDYYFENKIYEFLLVQIEYEENENRNLIYNLLIYIFNKKNSLLLDEDHSINKLMEINLIKLLFEEKKELLIIIFNIIHFEKYNIKDINIKLFKIFNDLEEEEINEDFLNFLLELVTMDNKYILRRFESFLGYPSLIIKSIPNENNNIENNKKEYHQKWPLFGEKLMNGDIKRHIYEYKCINHIKNNICLLSLLFPNDYDDENNTNKNISEKFKKKLIMDLLNNCLKEKNNYYLFKYIYLMPSRNLLYNNLYEEMISILKDEKLFNFEEIKIKEKEFIKRIENELETSIKKIKNKEQVNNLFDDDFEYMSNFIGFKSDIIPGEIIREEISQIAFSINLSLQRIEYFTKYYKFDELRNALLNKNKYTECKIKNNDLENQDIKKEGKFQKKRIDYDVSIQNENSLFYSMLMNKEYYVLEDKLSESKINSESTIIRYNLFSKGMDEKKFFIKFQYAYECPYAKKINAFIPEIIYDKVEKNNYINFYTIYKIREDLPLIESCDSYIGISFDTDF